MRKIPVRTYVEIHSSLSLSLSLSSHLTTCSRILLQLNLNTFNINKTQVPSTIENMNLTASSSCSFMASQSSCDIECDEGYTASNPTMTCVRGEWVGTATCEPSACDTLPPVEFIDTSASAECMNTESGASCNVTCMSGYSEAVTTTATCHKGVWSGSEAIDEVQSYELLKFNAYCSGHRVWSTHTPSGCATFAISRGLPYFSVSSANSRCCVFLLYEFYRASELRIAHNIRTTSYPGRA